MKILYAVSVFSVIVGLSLPQARAESLPEDLREDLSNVGRTFGPIRIDWILQRRSSDNLEKLVEKLNSQRLNFFLPEPGQFIVDETRYYEEIDREHVDENQNGNKRGHSDIEWWMTGTSL